MLTGNVMLTPGIVAETASKQAFFKWHTEKGVVEVGLMPWPDGTITVMAKVDPEEGFLGDVVHLIDMRNDGKVALCGNVEHPLIPMGGDFVRLTTEWKPDKVWHSDYEESSSKPIPWKVKGKDRLVSIMTSDFEYCVDASITATYNASRYEDRALVVGLAHEDGSMLGGGCLLIFAEDGIELASGIVEEHRLPTVEGGYLEVVNFDYE